WRVGRGGSDYRLQAMVQIDDARWTLVLMDTLGLGLATLVQNQQELAIQVHKSHPLQRQWRGLARHFRIVYWRLADLQRQNAEDRRVAPSEEVTEAFFSGS